MERSKVATSRRGQQGSSRAASSLKAPCQEPLNLLVSLRGSNLITLGNLSLLADKAASRQLGGRVAFSRLQAVRGFSNSLAASLSRLLEGRAGSNLLQVGRVASSALRYRGGLHPRQEDKGAIPTLVNHRSLAAQGRVASRVGSSRLREGKGASSLSRQLAGRVASRVDSSRLREGKGASSLSRPLAGRVASIPLQVDRAPSNCPLRVVFNLLRADRVLFSHLWEDRVASRLSQCLAGRVAFSQDKVASRRCHYPLAGKAAGKEVSSRLQEDRRASRPNLLLAGRVASQVGRAVSNRRAGFSQARVAAHRCIHLQ
jgi:hypothetical protein